MRISIFKTCIISVLILVFFLSSCSQPLSFMGSATPSPTVTITPSPTITPTPTNTPTITPTATPQKLSYTQINSTNLDQLTPILTLGTGEPFKIEFSPDGKTIMIYGELQNCEFDIESKILQNCTEVDFNVNSPEVMKDHMFTDGWNTEPIIEGEDTYITSNGLIISARLREYSYYYLKGSIAKGEMYQHLYLSPDLKYLAATSQCAINGCIAKAYKAFLWNIETEEVIYEMIINEEENVHLISFSPDSSNLAYIDTFGTLKVIEIKTNELLVEYPLGVGSSLQFSPDGNYLATSGILGNVYLWSTANGNTYKIIKTNMYPFSQIANTPDEEWGELYQNLSKEEFLPLILGKGIFSFSFDGKYLAFNNLNTEYTTIWNIETGNMIGEFPNSRSVDFISNDQFIMNISNGKTRFSTYYKYQYKINDNKEIERNKAYPIKTDIIGASAKYIVTISTTDNLTATIWDIQNSVTEYMTIPYFENYYWREIPHAAAHFSADGSKVAILFGNQFSLVNLDSKEILQQYDFYSNRYKENQGYFNLVTDSGMLWNQDMFIASFGIGEPSIGDFQSIIYEFTIIDPDKNNSSNLDGEANVAFSPDGTLIAISMSNNYGVKLFAVK